MIVFREPSPNSAVDQSILGIVVDQLQDAIDGEIKLKITAYNGLNGEVSVRLKLGDLRRRKYIWFGVQSYFDPNSVEKNIFLCIKFCTTIARRLNQCCAFAVQHDRHSFAIRLLRGAQLIHTLLFVYANSSNLARRNGSTTYEPGLL